MHQSNELSLPILEIMPEGILSKNGDFTVCFELTKPPLFSLSPAQLETWHQAWVKAIKALPYGTVIHIADSYYPSSWSDDRDFEIPQYDFPKFGITRTPDPDIPLLKQTSDSHFKGRGYRSNTTHLYVTKRAPGARRIHSGTSSLLNKSLLPEAILQPRQLQNFIDQCERFRKTLNESKLVECKPWSKWEMGRETSPNVVESDYGLRQDGSELSDIQFIDGLKHGARNCAMYTLADADHLPGQCSSWVPYGPYSTTDLPFPVGFATTLGPLLDNWHIYNQ